QLHEGDLIMSNVICNQNTSCAPRNGFRDLEQHLDRIFHGIVPPTASGSWVPPVDIHETKDAFVMTADLPGLKKEDINLQIVEDRVTLKGSRKRVEESATETGYRRYERAEGEFERSFRIRGGVDIEKVEAKFEHG